MTTHVLVTKVFYTPGETIARGFGIILTGPDAGQDIEFAGDWRPMLNLREAIKDGIEVEANVEDWQVLRQGEL